jgi:hypothetical protein
MAQDVRARIVGAAGRTFPPNPPPLGHLRTCPSRTRSCTAVRTRLIWVGGTRKRRVRPEQSNAALRNHLRPELSLQGSNQDSSDPEASSKSHHLRRNVSFAAGSERRLPDFAGGDAVLCREKRHRNDTVVNDESPEREEGSVLLSHCEKRRLHMRHERRDLLVPEPEESRDVGDAPKHEDRAWRACAWRAGARRVRRDATVPAGEHAVRLPR